MQGDAPTGADWTEGMPAQSKWMSPHERTYHKELAGEAPPYPTRALGPSGAGPQHSTHPGGGVHQPNSFTGMSTAAEERNAKLQAILNKTLGADQIASRAGGGGSKLNYLEGWRAINIANDTFGFNGWFTDIKYLEADFVDYDPASQRWHVGVTAIVRVRLQDGASHEDVGYGKIENCRSKGEALDKSKKEAVTDGLKRALRHFGKLLGNCLYDRHYLESIKNMKAPKPKLDFDGIYKPERDNLAAMSGFDLSRPAAPRAQEPETPSLKREAAPAAIPPKAAPAAKLQRSATVGSSIPAHASAPKPAPAAVPAQQRPHSALTTSSAASMAPPAAKKPIQRAMTVPNKMPPAPPERSCATTPSITSDDDSLFATMELPDVGASEPGAAADDSGFGEVEGLADNSLMAIKEEEANARARRALAGSSPHETVPADNSESGSAAESAAAAQRASAQGYEDKRAAALARREANLQKKQSGPAPAPPPQPATTTTTTTAVPGAPRQNVPRQARAGSNGPMSAAQMLALSGPAGAGGPSPAPAFGNARPQALRLAQPPRTSSTFARSTSEGQNVLSTGGGGGDEAAMPSAGPRVAGTVPSLDVGAGIAKATQRTAPGPSAATTTAGRSDLSAAGGDAAFHNARTLKRPAADTGNRQDAISHLPPAAPQQQRASSGSTSARRTLMSPRQALQELPIDDVTGDVKRQRLSPH